MRPETAKQLIDLAYATEDIHQLRRLVIIASDACVQLDTLFEKQLDMMRRHSQAAASEAERRINNG